MPDDVAAERTTEVVEHVSVPPLALAPGVLALAATDAVAVLVQPVAELVTVTVYVPTELTIGFAEVPPETIPGPVQPNCVPPPAAESTADVLAHVSVPPVALAPGALVFVPTDAVAVLVQPDAELLTVTEYVPAELTRGLAVPPPETIPGPAQLKPVPDVVAAERIAEVVVHVSVPPVADAPGGVAVVFTDAAAVLVQPLAALLTVTV